MFSSISGFKECEQLQLEREKYPVKVETGNFFMPPQEFNFTRSGVASDLENSDEHDYSDTDPLFLELGRRSVESAQNSLNRIPESEALMNNLGLAYLNSGHKDNAIHWFEYSLKKNRNYFPALANLAKTLLLMGNIEKALEMYLAAEKYTPDNTSILNNVANIYFSKRQYERSLEYLQRVMKITPNDAAALSNIGTIYLVQKQVNKAINYYRKALCIKPDMPGVLNNLGVSFAMQRNYKKALKHFGAAWYLNKTSIGLLLNYARAYQDSDKHSEARDILEQYIKSKYDKRVAERLAWSCAMTKEYDRCIVLLKKLLSDSENNDFTKAKYLNNISVVFRCKKDLASALTYSESCMKIRINHPKEHYTNTAKLYFDLNKDNEAFKIIQVAESLYTDQPEILECMGRYYFETMNYAKSQTILRRAIELKPDLVDAYTIISVIEMEKERNYKEAEKILFTALKYNEGDIHVLNNLAYNYLLQQNTTEARKILYSPQMVEQEDCFVSATRGLLMLLEGNFQEGRRLYNLAEMQAKSDSILSKLLRQKKNIELAKQLIKDGKKEEAKKLLGDVMNIKAKYEYYREQANELKNSI